MSFNYEFLFDVYDIMKNYIKPNQLINILPDEPIEISMKLNKHIHMYIENNEFYPIDYSNFDKIDENKIISFVLNDSGVEYESIDGSMKISIAEPKLKISMSEMNSECKLKYLEILNNVKLSGTDLVRKRIDEISLEISKVNELINFIHQEKIHEKLNCKLKHYDSSGKDFCSTDNKNCSITFMHYHIFKNRDSYQEAIKFIENKGIIIKSINSSSLLRIMSKSSQKKLCNYEYVRKITNLYLLCLAIQCLELYKQYLGTCIKNIQYDPYNINKDLSFSDLVKGFFINEKTNTGHKIRIQDYNIDAVVRNKNNYSLVKNYYLFKYHNEWNIIYEGNNMDGLDYTSIKRYNDYLTYNNIKKDWKKM